MLHYVIISPYEDVAAMIEQRQEQLEAGIRWIMNDECTASLLCP